MFTKESLKSFKENRFLSTIFINSHYSSLPNRKGGNDGWEDCELILKIKGKLLSRVHNYRKKLVEARPRSTTKILGYSSKPLTNWEQKTTGNYLNQNTETLKQNLRHFWEFVKSDQCRGKCVHVKVICWESQWLFLQQRL